MTTERKVGLERKGWFEMTGKDVDRLIKAFHSGQLVRPSARVLNFVDLVNAIAFLAGAKGVQSAPGEETLCRKIGNGEHYLLVLVDGLGLDLLHRLPGDSFLRSNTVGALQAVFLSTTATALTTLATAQWPCSHSVPGWWTHLEDWGITAVTLPFMERFTKKPLAELGVPVQNLFTLPSFWPRLKHQPLSILPEDLVDSTFSIYACGGTARAGYKDLTDAIKTACESVLGASGPHMTYLYLPQVDDLSHDKGPEHHAVRDLLFALDQQLSDLVEAAAGRARIVITADHGQVQVSASKRFLLGEEDSLLSYLQCPPSGETNVPIFHVHRGQESSFVAEFSERFGRHFILLAPRDVERLRLLGPGDLSPAMRARMGTFVGIAQEPACICFGPPEESGSENNGVHGGLSRAEMAVPLIIPD
jgi:hypothetical protein